MSGLRPRRSDQDFNFNQDRVNPQFEDGYSYDMIQMADRGGRYNDQSHGDCRDARLSARMAMDASYVSSNMNDSVYDRSLEELIDELPSRQQTDDIATLGRNRRYSRKSFRQKTLRENTLFGDQVVNEFQQQLDSDEKNMDEVDANLRDMTATNLTQKRRIMQRLSSRRHKTLSRCKLCKYSMQMAWVRFKQRVLKGFQFLHLWRSHLMTIEGHFGTSVLSYFIFLKWVLLINLPIFLLTLSFLVIPQILYRYHQMPLPAYQGSESFTGIELLTGDGFFEDTEMYYGFYTNETVQVVKSMPYKMKYAYIFTCGGYYIFCLLILGYSYLHSYRKFYIENSGNFKVYFFSIAMCGWDYGIVSNEASQLKHKSLYQEFKENLFGGQSSSKPNRDEVAKKWLKRVLAWLVVLILLGASGYATYMVSVELSIKAKSESASMYLLSPMAMPVIISSIQLIVPMIFTWLESWEHFSQPKYELYVHMFRDMALKTTLLAVLVYFWLNIAARELACWETFVGQEIYRLVIVDLIFSLGYSFFMEFVRKLLSLQWKSVERAEFAVGRHTLELIYSQSLCWLGVFYSPLLPVVVILKLIIIFYVKRVSVVQNCKPSLKAWRASRTHTIFVGYLFGFYVLTCVAVGCGIFLIKPSTECGPYANTDTSYDVITELTDEWKTKHEVLKEIFVFIESPGFVAALLVLLGMVWYYMRTVMLTHKQMVARFKRQLNSEGKDKKFLLALLNQVKVKGRRVSKHQGPIHQTMTSMSPNDSRGGNKVFVKTVAESVVSSSRGL